MLYFSGVMLAILQYLSLTYEQMKDKRTVIEASQHYMDGHINKAVKHRNFQWKMQQSGKSFVDFLITIKELVKTCKFCSDTCAQESSIHDQIIEGIVDGSTIEDLLQEVGQILATIPAK